MSEPANPTDPAGPRPPGGLSPDEVRRVAHLSMLELNDAQVAAERERLSAVLGHIETLRELDLEGVEPMAHPDANSAPTAPRSAPLAPDEPHAPMPQPQALRNAPATTSFPNPDGTETVYFRVPKVLGDGGGA